MSASSERFGPDVRPRPPEFLSVCAHQRARILSERSRPVRSDQVLQQHTSGSPWPVAGLSQLTTQGQRRHEYPLHHHPRPRCCPQLGTVRLGKTSGSLSCTQRKLPPLSAALLRAHGIESLRLSLPAGICASTPTEPLHVHTR